MLDVVAKVERSNEYHINQRRYFFHRFQCFPRLDLHHGQETLVCLLQVLGRSQAGLEILQREGRPKAPLSLGRELGRGHYGLHFLDRSDQWY